MLLADLGTKHWATVSLATPVHPILVQAGDAPTPLLALAARAGGEEAVRREATSGAVVRLERQPLDAAKAVDADTVGRDLVVAEGIRLPVPRRFRFGSEHIGKPVQDVLADAWRVEPDSVQGLLDRATWTVTARRLDPDASFAGGRAYALLDRSITWLDAGLHGDLVYAENKGAAFSFLESAPAGLRWGLFVVISSIASLVLIYWLARGTLISALSAWSMAAILSGALGNLIDRVRYTVVVDFIYNFVVIDGRVHGWPVYNVADIGITVGFILIALESLVRKPATLADPAQTPAP